MAYKQSAWERPKTPFDRLMAQLNRPGLDTDSQIRMIDDQTRFKMTGQDAIPDPETDQILQVKDRLIADKAERENRSIMRNEMAEREETARNYASFGPSYMPAKDWSGGMPRADSRHGYGGKWQTFWDNNAVIAAHGAMGKGGVAHPGGAQIMGSGDTIGTAASAEHAEGQRQQQAAQAMQSLQAQGSGGGGGGTGGGGNGGGTGGQITMSPGGNYSRAAAWTPFDFIRQREAEARAKAAEESVPSVKAERERNDAAFRRNTGIADIEAEQAGREAGITAGTADEAKRRIASRTYFDPDVYRQMESEDRRKMEAGDPGREIAGLKMQYDLAGKQAQANATMQAAKTKAEAAQTIAILTGVLQAAKAKAGNLTFGAEADQVKSLEEAIAYLKQFGGEPQPNLPGLIR